MRIGWVLGCMVLWGCGNGTQSQPTTPTPSVTQSAAPVVSAAPSASAVATAPSATATTPPPTPMKTLAEVLANAKTIKLSWRPKLDSNETQSIEIKTPATIKAILDTIGPDQRPEGGGPGYMSTFDLRFEDQGGNPLATLSLFASPTMSDSNKKYGRINVADGTYGGITVAKYGDLQTKLKALGVTLP
jgi:hypothetical protein